MKHVKTIIIGAGPGGASAAMYLARFNHEVLLLDAPQEIRGRTSWAYELETVLGFTHPTAGIQFLENVKTQLEKFGVVAREETVTGVSCASDGRFTVKTAKPAHYVCDYLVVAVGVYDILPDVSGVDTYFGHSLFPCPACNWYQTKDRITGIVSNGDRGITTARAFNSMQPGSAKCVFPDRPDFSYSTELVKQAEAEGIIIYRSPIICLNGSRGKLESVELADCTVIKLEILYTRLGVKRHDAFLDLDNIQLRRDTEGYIEVDFKTLESSVPNLFAVGPCNSGEDQVMVAAGQGTVAALHIHEHILTDRGI